VNGLGRDERLAGGLEVADDAGVVEPPVQQQELGLDAHGGHPPAEFARDLVHRRAAGDREDGQREAEPVADDEGGGVAVEVGGAVLGLAPEDLVGGEAVVPVVGDERGVDGNDPPPAPPPARE
jgi:hypothetical protein